MAKKAYRYRFYPTDEQRQALDRTFGCVRFVYNWALALRRDTYAERGQALTYDDLSAALTQLKRDPAHSWLNDVSSVPLQQTLRHLDLAFRNHLAGRARYPVFKTKRGRQSATYVASAFSYDGGRLTLGRMRGPLDIRWSRRFGGRPSSVAVSKDAAGRYFVSFTVEEETEAKRRVVRAIGIDLGIHTLIATSDGETISSPRPFRRAERRLSKAHRDLSRKQRGSRNREKARLTLARAYARVADTRMDYLHKLTTTLIDENQVICVEGLSVQALHRKRRLAKPLRDLAWGELLRQLEYKASWYGRTLVRIDRYFPSSKRCSSCGHTLAELSVKVRRWTCPACGAEHDRDINAAKNVLAAGLAATACGDPVRPEVGSSRGGAAR